MRVVALAMLLISNLAMAEEEIIYDAVIVGGGFAGMTAAYHLKGQNILVLEQWPEVGGRSWDGEYKGFSYAKGAEYMGEPWGITEKIIKEYKLNPVDITYPSYCYYNPDVLGYEDVTIWNGTDGIAFMHVAEEGENKKALKNYNKFMSDTTALVNETYDAGEYPYSFDLNHPVAKYDYVTMSEWFENNGFGHSYQDKWNAHARGLYGANIHEVSILMAISELGWEYYEEKPIKMPDISWNDYKTGFPDEGIKTFMGGLSVIPKAIAKDKDLRSKIRTDSVVIKVREISGNSKANYKVVYKHRVTKKVFTVKAKTVIMATPANVTCMLMDRALPDKIRETVCGIEYCEYLTVNMFSDEPIQDFTFELATPSNFFAIAFYDSLWVQKNQNPDNPLNDEVFITTAYIAGKTCAEPLVSLTDEEILARTYKDLDRVWPGASKKVTKSEINRFKNGYPLFGPGAYHKITELNRLNMKQKKFRLVGDYLALPTLEGAMEQASYATKGFKVD